MSFRRMARTALVIAATFLSLSAASLAAQLSNGSEPDVLRATLPNGLRVAIVRNTLAPVVTTSVNYLVGSDEAPAGFPGTAHAQEHMMFRGSPGLSADQLADIGSLMGGRFNADTRESVTQYLFTVPASNLDVALHIEALRMADVSDRQEDWDRERGAIEQEVAQDLSDPFYVLYEKLRQVLFAGTVYEHDALGTRPSFDRTTAAMLKRFHDAWYAPNNAILVIAGDVDPNATLTKVRQLFGSIPAKRLPGRPSFALKPVHPMTLSLPTNDPNTMQILALRMPGLDSPDFPAAEVLADVLNSHRFALYGLVPQGKAIATEFALQPLPRAGLAYAAVSISSTADATATAQTLRSILLQVARSGVSPDLVAAAKLQEERDTEFQKNSIEGLASIWSDAVALYGLPSPEADLARIEKVTVADVNRVARKYLDVDRAVSATMTPRNSGEPVLSGGFGGQESFSLTSQKATALPSWADTLFHNLSLPPSASAPVMSKLANGLTLIVQPESVSKTVSIFGHIRNRPETEEPGGKEGVAPMLDQMMSYGTTRLDRLAFQSALDAIGADEDAGTDFHIRALSAHFDRAAELLAGNELAPALPEAELGNVRDRIEPYIASRNVTPEFLTQQAIRQSVYPDDDASLRHATAASVDGVTLQDVKAYYDKVFRPDLTTIVIIGDVTPERARAVIDKYFGPWAAHGPLPVTDLPPVPSNAAHTILVPDASRVQDSVVLAQNLGLMRSNPDYYALALGNALLSGGFYASRFSVDLRKNAGLVYSVNADFSMSRTRSVYLVDYASDPQNVRRAAEIVARDIDTLRHLPPAEEELDRAKALLLQQIVLDESSVDDIAGAILKRQDLGLPLDEPADAAAAYIGLTPVAVQQAFAKWMQPEDLSRVVRGPSPPA